MNDGCNGCKYEDTPCIIRICGNAPRATAEDKMVMLNKMKLKKRGRNYGTYDSGTISNVGK